MTSTAIYTVSLWGGATHLTHKKKENTWGTINVDKLPGDDKTYAHTLPKHK